jgi:hypothetical protein
VKVVEGGLKEGTRNNGFVNTAAFCMGAGGAILVFTFLAGSVLMDCLSPSSNHTIYYYFKQPKPLEWYQITFLLMLLP